MSSTDYVPFAGEDEVDRHRISRSRSMNYYQFLTTVRARTHKGIV